MVQRNPSVVLALGGLLNLADDPRVFMALNPIPCPAGHSRPHRNRTCLPGRDACSFGSQDVRQTQQSTSRFPMSALSK